MHDRMWVFSVDIGLYSNTMLLVNGKSFLGICCKSNNLFFTNPTPFHLSHNERAILDFYANLFDRRNQVILMIIVKSENIGKQSYHSLTSYRPTLMNPGPILGNEYVHLTTKRWVPEMHWGRFLLLYTRDKSKGV